MSTEPACTVGSVRSASVSRSTREVIDDHLARRQNGDVDGDIARNYAADVVLLSAEGISHGHDGIRSCNRVLREHIPQAGYSYLNVLVHQDIGFLQWQATGQERVFFGSDTFIVNRGKIVVQTIHFYGTEPRAEGDLGL